MISKTAAKVTHGARSRIKDRDMWKRIAIALGFIVAIVYFYPHPRASHYNFEQGRPWNYAKLIAPFDLPVHPDSASVRTSTDSLKRIFLPVYVREDVDVDGIVNTARSRMASYRSTPEASNAKADAQSIRRFEAAFASLLRTAYSRGVLADSLPAGLGTTHRAQGRLLDNKVLHTIALNNVMTVSRLLGQADSLATVYHQKRALQNAGLQALLQPSLVCDEDESMRLLQNDLALVTIDRGVIQRGQTIIDKGTIITAQDYTNLKTYESMLADAQNESQRDDWLMLLGQWMYVTWLIMSLMAYLYLYERTVYGNLKAVVFLLTLITLMFVTTVFVTDIIPGGIYLVPLTIVPVLCLVFFNGRTALWTSVVAILLCAGTTTFPFEFIFMQISVSTAAVLSLRELTKRQQLLMTSLYVLVVYWCTYLAVELMMNGSLDAFSWRVMGSLGVNAVLASMAYVFMFLVERLFGFISNVTLVELTDTNSPLLRELSDECPGTFQHSVAVSTLAADGARAIGADTLMVRAGAMYHDIGKMGNPIFFTENQHGVNPHDGLTPEKSAEIIIGHVTEGVRRADKARLPSVIKNFIREHHGCGRAKYFYVTACNATADGNVDPAPFTYPGPNPQSRETSVLMMADAVEAASRSLKTHSQKEITGLVDKIIDGQIADGMHDESPLAFRDVARIKAAFVKRLMTIYHSRISYPDAKKPS